MDISKASVEKLIVELAARSAAPLTTTRGSPPPIYNRPEFLDVEMERIFKREWTCPGLAAEIPNAGDYITFSIGDQALYVIRGVDNQIRTFSNVCRHRLMTLVEGRGNKRKVVCPYHAWTYDSTGRLIGAGHMQKTEGFKKEDICLPQIRTEIWEGWIYVTLDSHAESVAKRLAELAPLVERFDMIGYVPVIQQDHVWDTNWKLLCENFLEGYHASFVHQQTVGAGFSVEKTEFPDTVHDAFTYQLFSKDEKAKFGRAHPDNKRLEGKWRHTSVLAFAYPTHLYSLAPDYLWYLSLRPHGTGQVHVRIGVAIAPEVLAASEDRDELVGTLTTFFDQANEEDRIVVEGIYRGSQSPLAESGPLSWLERSIYDFMGYLARKLAPPSQAGGAPY